MRPDATRCLLLIDDEPAQRRLVTAIGARAGWWVTRRARLRGRAADARSDPQEPKIDAILLDHWLPGEAGTELIEQIRALRPDLPLLVLTAQTSVAVAVDAMRAGASDFLVKPLAPDRLLAALNAATDRRKAQRRASPAVREDLQAARLRRDRRLGAAIPRRAGDRRQGRPRPRLGADRGRERLGQGNHRPGDPRRLARAARSRCITVNCGAIPDNLVESVLFGHEKGAFTGAFDRHIGRFEDADGSTLFLDEVGELPLDTQVKLLRALETGEIQRVGGRIIQTVDVRIIAATNRRLIDEVAARPLPRGPLLPAQRRPRADPAAARPRTATFPPLARHLLARIAEQPGMRHLSITDDALAVLMSYGWPGNVRQLQNALFRAAVLCEGDALTAADFPQIATEESTYRPPRRRLSRQAAQRRLAAPRRSPTAPASPSTSRDGNLRPLEEIEADVIRLAIGHYRGRMTEVARRLGIGRSTLYRKLGELGIGDVAA